MERTLKLMALVAISLVFAGCASVAPSSGSRAPAGYAESGKASYYAMKYQFRRTASGERFNQLAKTGAHRSLPFGTRVRVTNVRNGKSVVVRINDRGPFLPGRVIDLSRSAFSKIGDTDLGLLDVRLEVVR